MRQVNSTIKTSEPANLSCDSINALEANSKSKKVLTCMRTKKKTKSLIGTLKGESDVLTQNDRYMVQVPNKIFTSLFTVENIQPIPESSTQPIELPPVIFDTTDERDMHKYPDKLEKSKSTRPDALSPKQLIFMPLTPKQT